MRILIYGINYTPELTGIGKYTGELAQWLAGRGHEVYLVTAPPYYPDWRVGNGYLAWRYRREFDCGIQVWRCPLWVPKKPSGWKRIVHLASFSFSSFPVMLMRALQAPDVVIAIEPPIFCAPGAAFAAWLSRAKAWLHVQDFEVDAAFDLGLVKGGWPRRVIETLEKLLMQRFHCVSTISQRMMDRLEDKGVAEARRIFFPNWVDTQTIHPLSRPSTLRGELGIRDNEIVALYSGNMGQKQGLEIVIEAARELAKTPGLRFVMCGQGAAYEDLRTLGNGLKNMFWIPLQPVNRLNSLLNLADIHLLPQRADAADLVMPSKLTGILASGRPVVATAAKDTEVWQVMQGRGLIVEPGDAKAFANAILNLSKDSAQRQALGVASRSYAVTHLDYEKIMENFETELLKLTGAQAKKEPL
jgi:colanic acid biosynthesis glycosyl transferase WcaI